MLINKQRLKVKLPFITSAVVVCVLWFPLILSAMSGPDGYGNENPIPVGLQYSLPLSSESDDVEIIDSLDNKNIFADLEQFQGGLFRYDFYYGSFE